MRRRNPRGKARAKQVRWPRPPHILNAPTKLMKDIGYGAGYAYDHDADDGFSGADYWPEEMDAQDYYQPVERGFERKIRERLEYWERKRRELREA